MTGDEKWIHYSNPKRRKSWGLSSHASTSSARPNIHAAKVTLCNPLGRFYLIWAVEIESHDHWGTVSNVIDAFESITARKTATMRAEARKSDCTA